MLAGERLLLIGAQGPRSLTEAESRVLVAARGSRGG